ncbi:MAG: GvpL/GvpF family gas vesicle protein [Desulfitobacteriaceae bacterium]
MKGEDEFRDGLKRLVLQELKDLGFEKLVSEVLKETLTEIIHTTLTGLADGNKFAEPEEEKSLAQENIGFPVPDDPPVINTAAEAIYLYGIAESCENTSFGPIGICDGQVYTISDGSLLAIVQNCVPEPYVSQDDEQVKQWLFIQQEVLDLAQEKFGTNLPMGFNTIIHTEGEQSVETVRNWLRRESTRLRQIFEQVRGKNEYGIQVLVEDETLKRSLLDENQEFQRLKQEAESKPEGARYMYRQRLEKAAQDAIEEAGERYFHEVYDAVIALSDDVRVEKLKKSEVGLRMIVNLSCLVAEEKVEGLGLVVGEINARKGFHVHFTGPWPPYNFVESLSIPNGKSTTL